MNKKPNEPGTFGKLLYQKRMDKKIGLREICRTVNFDPSNWSKIERSKMAPPSDPKVLSEWALALGIKKNSEEYHSFIEYAQIAQGIIPNVIPEKEMLKLLRLILI